MPEYRWKGITIFGDIVYGKHFARSKEKLDAALFRQEIALLNATQIRPWRTRHIPLHHKVHFFRHLAMLIAAGVRVSDALSIVAASLHSKVKAMVIDVSHAVKEGFPLSLALSHHEDLIDTNLIPLIVAGEESGHLSAGLERTAFYIESVQLLQTKVKRALIMPLVSFLFFIIMACISVIAIVPRFQDLFASLGKPLLWATSVVFGINDWLRSGNFIAVIFIALLVITVCWSIRHKQPVRTWYDWILLRVPFLGTLLYNKDSMLFLQTLSVLLEGEVHLAKALPPAIKIITNTVTRRRFEKLEKEIVAGRRLSDMLARVMESSELCGLIAIGEASGTLVIMVQQAATLYQERLNHQLELLTTAIQPILLISMGLMIALLVMVIYTPLLTLSDALF